MEPEPQPAAEMAPREPQPAVATAPPASSVAVEEQEAVIILDTDGDISEYLYEGEPGALVARYNGERHSTSVTAFVYYPAMHRLNDGTYSLTLPAESEPSPDDLIARLQALCALAQVGFREQERPRLAAPWGVALPRCLCVRLTSGPTASYTRECLLHCGVSNSAGLVAHFPSNHILDGDIWSDCVCVSLDKTDLTDDAFDAALVGHVMDERERLEWAPYQNAFDHDLLLERQRSQEAENNCFSFCARFLSAIRYAGTTEHDKMGLVEKHGIA